MRQPALDHDAAVSRANARMLALPQINPRLRILIALVASALVVLGAGLPWREGLAYFWSPYYWVAYEEAPLRITRSFCVNVGSDNTRP